MTALSDEELLAKLERAGTMGNAMDGLVTIPAEWCAELALRLRKAEADLRTVREERDALEVEARKAHGGLLDAMESLDDLCAASAGPADNGARHLCAQCGRDLPKLRGTIAEADAHEATCPVGGAERTVAALNRIFAQGFIAARKRIQGGSG